MNEHFHRYSTRSFQQKIKVEDNNGQQYLQNHGAVGQSPSAVGKLCVKTSNLEFASPSHRPMAFLCSQSENEVEWDLTSPSARKYQTLFSDKTSTPNRTTPSRNQRGEQRSRRPALCKKNIAKGTTESSSLNLFNELAALNELVNSEQAQQSHHIPYHKENKCLHSDSSVSSSKDLGTSDVFSDDSFSFSESMLLSTQALEAEALECSLNSKDHIKSSDKKRKKTRSSSPVLSGTEANLIRDQLTPPGVFPIGAITHLPNTSCEPTVSKQIQSVPSVSKNKPSSTNIIQVPKSGNYVMNAKNVTFNKQNVPQPTRYPPLPSNARSLSQSTAKTALVKKATISGPKNVDVLTPPPSHGQHVVPKIESVPSEARELFDDSFDDLLCAVAEEVESQFVGETQKESTSVSAAVPVPALVDDDDDELFQPEVLEWISQIETQAMASSRKITKTTADLVEEKRQAAILRRTASQQRVQNRKP